MDVGFGLDTVKVIRTGELMKNSFGGYQPPLTSSNELCYRIALSMMPQINRCYPYSIHAVHPFS